MAMEYNKSPISLREGHVYIDGVECADCVKCTITVTPEVWTGRQLGELTPSSRWIGESIAGQLTRRRSTPWMKDAIQKYQNSKATTEFTVQGIMDDENSDYYAEYGTFAVTAVGCVLTGDLPLTALDSDGEIVDDALSFNAKEIIFGS